MKKKTLADWEAAAAKKGECLVHPVARAARATYEARHGKVVPGYEVRCSCKTVGCVLDKHHFIRSRKKTVAEYEKEAIKVGKCLVHPTKDTARRVYQLRHGKVPSNIYVCHKCDVRRCIRDSHHFLGSQYDNMQDMKRKGRQRGCEWTAEKRMRRSKESIQMWRNPIWHAEQKQRIKDGWLNKVWTKEETARRVAASKRGHVTRAENKAKAAMKKYSEERKGGKQLPVL
jgi:hypothetical protein